MVIIPTWVAGAALSLVVILLGNFIQSSVEEWRERRRKRKQWYEETAILARQIKQVYDRRKAVHDRRRAESDDLRDEMSSGVKNEILEEMQEKMDELDAHTRTDFTIDDAVMDAIDTLDQTLILAKREGVLNHIDDLLDQCEELADLSEEKATEYGSLL